MWQAILIVALVLGIALSGLLLLKRTANMPPPESTGKPRPQPEDEDEDDRESW